ncbi:hypothetical protein VNO77_17158 [Canavalia gladiata]|uniref:Uncharacterized protein n=1 Tax=Canavalia gladiata TaxID=3824 RepID=A0AAN9LIG4_CANGL
MDIYRIKFKYHEVSHLCQFLVSRNTAEDGDPDLAFTFVSHHVLRRGGTVLSPMATLIGCQYYYLLFLLWFLSTITFFVDSHIMFLRIKIFLLGNIHPTPTSTSLARCWDQFTPIFPLGLYADLPTTHMLALAFHS